MKTACIIGAGASGITAAKTFREQGIDFDCFEKGSGIGGNWRYGNDNGMSSAYRSLHIISSKWNMQYSDYPMPEDFPDYGHHSDVLRYFENYVDHFGIRETIRFHCEVKEVTPHSRDGWEVTLAGGERRNYRAVVVANGHHWNPRWPEFPGSFHGEAIHSHHYKTPEAFEDKNVLIVGIGNSACDIAVDLSRLARTVHLSTRRSAYVLPKYVLGIPNDQWLHPLFDYFPLALRRTAFRILAYMTVGNQERYGLPRPRHKLLQEHPTLNQEFLSYVGHGRIKIKPDIRELQGERVGFVDGSSEPFDTIIYATGYNITFPFLKPEVFTVQDNRVHLYRRVIDPELPNLFFLGLIQPLGAIMPLAELQARWIAGLLNGEMALPDEGRMRRDIEADRSLLRRRYTDSARHTIQVDFWDYVHQLKREMRKGKKLADRKRRMKGEG